uniref:Uncharacterized protein n=1 Tax=Oryza sativa subsp. japonica TaxID=39947 RepID=Q69XP4_ORYSJ|nr:hypothetical protein [Oryza sativa Japonica Group]
MGGASRNSAAATSNHSASPTHCQDSFFLTEVMVAPVRLSPPTENHRTPVIVVDLRAPPNSSDRRPSPCMPREPPTPCIPRLLPQRLPPLVTGILWDPHAIPSYKVRMGRHRVVVREDALKMMTVTRSRQSLRKMTPKSLCCRTVEDETSCRVCQTWGQLGTNARNGVANTARARLETTMNHTPMSEETSREGLQDGHDTRTA